MVKGLKNGKPEHTDVVFQADRCIILHADCMDVMSRLHEYTKEIGADRPKLCFMDPPFNQGVKYDEYDDSQNWRHFSKTIRVWSCRLMWQLDFNGVLFLHGPDKLVDIWIPLQQELKWSRIDWINWHYRFGQCTDKKFIDSRCHGLVYAKGPNYTWNPEPIMVPSERLLSGDKRVEQSKYKGLRVPLNVWGVKGDEEGFCRIQGNNKERVPACRNQLPEAYMRRIILAYTNPGDLVFDPCCGSGTTAKVALELDRKVITCDISKSYCEQAIERIRKVEQSA